jgi:hypothetical protein
LIFNTGYYKSKGNNLNNGFKGENEGKYGVDMKEDFGVVGVRIIQRVIKHQYD